MKTPLPLSSLCNSQYSFTHKVVFLLPIYNCSNRIFDYSLICASPKKSKFILWKPPRQSMRTWSPCRQVNGLTSIFPRAGMPLWKDLCLWLCWVYPGTLVHSTIHLYFSSAFIPGNLTRTYNLLLQWTTLFVELLMNVPTELDGFLFLLCLMKLISRQVKNT